LHSVFATAWTPWSVWATDVWHAVQVAAFAFTSPRCGAWHPMHATLPPCSRLNAAATAFFPSSTDVMIAFAAWVVV